MKKTMTILLLTCFAITTVTLTGFPIEDQYRVTYSFASLFKGAPVIILAGNKKKTARYIKRWVNVLRKKYGRRIAIYGLADLDGIPFFVSNNSIRKRLKKTCPELSILCDWDGKLYKKMKFPKKRYSMRIYDKNKKLVTVVFGDFSLSRIRQVNKALKNIL